MYRERMNSYYPKVIRNISEFKAIVDAEYPEFEALADGATQITNDAYFSTMGEERVMEWESILGIKPIDGSSIVDRRETIIARIRGQGKLNTSLINSIVKTFTGGTANSWVENNILYVEITPPPKSKQFQFDNVKQELQKKIPAHMGFEISRNYFTWGEIATSFETWEDMYTELSTWEDVYLFVPFTSTNSLKGE